MLSHPGIETDLAHDIKVEVLDIELSSQYRCSSKNHYYGDNFLLILKQPITPNLHSVHCLHCLSSALLSWSHIFCVRTGKHMGIQYTGAHMPLHNIEVRS